MIIVRSHPRRLHFEKDGCQNVVLLDVLFRPKKKSSVLLHTVPSCLKETCHVTLYIMSIDI